MNLQQNYEAELATFLMLTSTDACRKCWSPDCRWVNYSKILSSIQLKLLFVLSTAQEAILLHKLADAHPQKSFSGKDIALKTTCVFLKTLANNIELF